MKNIQSLTLMMAVMVYAAPTPREDRVQLLGDILGTAQTLHNEELHFNVPIATPSNGSKCPTEFFCLAEKALNNTSTQKEIKKANLPETAATNVDKLIRELHQYNKMKKVNCSLDTTLGQRPIKKFLKAIEDCSTQEINKTQHG